MNCHSLENKEQEIFLYCGWSALHYQAPALLCLSFSGLDNQLSIRKDAGKPQLQKGDLFLSFTGAWTFKIISSIKILKNLCRTDDSKKKIPDVLKKWMNKDGNNHWRVSGFLICFLVLFSHFCPYRCATFTIISSGFHVSLVTLFSRGFSVARWAKESLQIMLWNPHIGHPRNLWTSWNLYRRWPGLICLWMHAIIIIF